MTQYKAAVTAYGQAAEELAEMLETAAERIRNQEYDHEGNGLSDTEAQVATPNVSGEGADDRYHYIVTATSDDPQHFRTSDWNSHNGG